VLFLVRSDGRAASINSALARWRAELVGPGRSELRALPFRMASAELRQMANLPALPKEGAKPASETPVPPAAATLTLDEVKVLEQCLDDAMTSIKHARAVFRTLARVDLPPYPNTYESARVLLARLASKPAA
jgi:hypothetical protein